MHVVFPVKEASEAANLEKLLAILNPLAPLLIDGGWLAFGGEDPGELVQLTRQYPWLRLFRARQFPPPDQPEHAWGKGAVMRALLYYLAHSGEVTDPRTIIQFIDADIVPSYFSPNWFLGAGGDHSLVSYGGGGQSGLFPPPGRPVKCFFEIFIGDSTPCRNSTPPKLNLPALRRNGRHLEILEFGAF